MSALSQAVEDYLRLRRSFGHKLTEPHRLLPRFVAYLDSAGVEVYHDRRGARVVAAARRQAKRHGLAQPAIGRARVRSLHGRDRPANRNPASRPDPSPQALAAAVHLQRR